MTRRPSTTPTTLRSALTLGAAIATAALAVPVLAGGGIEGAQVRRGDVKFDRQGNRLTVTASNGAIIDYNRFSIAAGEVAQFVQPTANSRVLNRVTGREMSRIDGALPSNGIVYLVNPQGIRVGSGAFVNVGGFHAAAGAIADQDFINGVDRFTGLTGQVTNEGLIRAESVTLVGQYVANRGTIDVQDGVVAMAAGDSVYLQRGSGPIMVSVTRSQMGEDGSGKGEQAGVSNTGTITAGKGQAAMVSGDFYALGLDLSFVRHVFLLEPLADAALESQVVSRAHRMGAAAPVHVEVLAMRGTAEEHMVALRCGGGGGGGAGCGGGAGDREARQQGRRASG